jgi:hypothetical protein
MNATKISQLKILAIFSVSDIEKQFVKKDIVADDLPLSIR